jgi:Domain of unknown function (DUF4190)
MSDILKPANPAAPKPAPESRPPGEAVHDGLAIASLVLSLVYIGGLGSLLAVIFGHKSRGEARRAGRQPSGMATAGLVLGYIGLAVTVIAVIVIIAVAASQPDATQQYINCVNNAIANGTSTAGC